MKLLCHRGHWSERDEQNTTLAFQRALDGGNGIETDVRDLAGGLVISHDMPKGGEMPFEAFWRLCEPYSSTAVLALNIKSDGLQKPLRALLGDAPTLRFFSFDMSVPDALGYRREGLRFFTRQSEHEPNPNLYDEAAGVWLDCFSNEDSITPANIRKHFLCGKEVAVVSPELHGRAPDSYWRGLNALDDNHLNRLLLCTDMASKVMEVVREH